MAGAQNDGLSIAERRRRKREEQDRRRREQQGPDESAAPEAPDAAQPDAEPGDEADSAEALPTEALLSDLAHNPDNPREELENLDGMTDTFATVGVLQPVTVISAATFVAEEAFPEHAKEIGSIPWVVITGNRRLAAARKAGLEKLPVHVNTMVTTREQITVAAMVENIQREDLSPFEELRSIEKLKSVLGTYGDVAKRLGKSEGWVSQRRKLNNLQPEVREAVRLGPNVDGGIGIELARELGKIKDRDKQLAQWRTSMGKPAKSSAKTSRGSRKGDRGAGDGRVPAQKSGEQAEARDNRRASCALAVSDTAEAAALPIHLLAMRHPENTDEVHQLATEWLEQAGVSAALLAPGTLPGEDQALQQKTALALALAHCEVFTERTGYSEEAHTQEYLGWLASTAEFKPATDAEHRILAHLFTA